MSRWLGEKRDDDKSLKCDNMELWQKNDVTQNRRDRKGGKNWRNYAMENERGESLLGRSDITFQRERERERRDMWLVIMLCGISKS